MDGNPVERIPTGWDDARDLAFFRITAGLFDWDFCFGASVLLAANDDEAVPAPQA